MHIPAVLGPAVDGGRPVPLPGRAGQDLQDRPRGGRSRRTSPDTTRKGSESCSGSSVRAGSVSCAPCHRLRVAPETYSIDLPRRPRPGHKPDDTSSLDEQRNSVHARRELEERVRASRRRAAGFGIVAIAVIVAATAIVLVVPAGRRRGRAGAGGGRGAAPDRVPGEGPGGVSGFRSAGWDAIGAGGVGAEAPGPRGRGGAAAGGLRKRPPAGGHRRCPRRRGCGRRPTDQTAPTSYATSGNGTASIADATEAGTVRATLTGRDDGGAAEHPAHS